VAVSFIGGGNRNTRRKPTKLLQLYNISESSENIFFVRALEISRKANCCRACLAFYGARKINSIFTGNVCILCISCKKKVQNEYRRSNFLKRTEKILFYSFWRVLCPRKKNIFWSVTVYKILSSQCSNITNAG
jgi:hypothetical protein